MLTGLLSFFREFSIHGCVTYENNKKIVVGELVFQIFYLQMLIHCLVGQIYNLYAKFIIHMHTHLLHIYYICA